MRLKFALFFFLNLITHELIRAQPCTTLGQTPSTAFPVCGTKVFNQFNVPLCNTNSLFVPGCTGTTNANYANKNPFFYKFTCYTSGSLGFTITPNNLGDDYDWQLYDITGFNPDDLFTNNNLIVTGNWSGSSGLTGASSSGVNFIQCASDPTVIQTPTFSKMPALIAGHIYILMISHFTDSQSGYTLEFKGGTASITDPLIPSLKTALPECDSKKIVVRLGKKITCNSIAGDGSDFTLSPAIANVINVSGFFCSAGFDTDSLLVTLDQTIPPGNYFLVANKGTDGNTLLDFCDNQVPVGEKVPFAVNPLLPTPVDSLSPFGCAPDKLVLVFKKLIQCSSISPDGSDFIVTGSSLVNVIGATGSCNSDGNTSIITLTLSQPISTAGNYTITLKNGLDGNPIIDQCGIPTPVGPGPGFTTKDTVNADFTYNINVGCKTDLVTFLHNGNNGVNKWQWSFDNNISASTPLTQVLYKTPGPKKATLAVSNGVCSDTASTIFILDRKLTASFLAPDVLCPEDQASFIDSSYGNIISWQWNFANGNTATTQVVPMQSYPTPFSPLIYKIRLIVSDGNCIDTTYRNMKVVPTCKIAVPNAFTPNYDGLNDNLYPLNAYKAVNLQFRVYNRYGQLVFETKDWNIRWNGKFKDIDQPTGTYAWYLKYTQRDTGKDFFLKGTTLLIR